jgi:hypothetical protein
LRYRSETDSSWLPDANPTDALGIDEQRDPVIAHLARRGFGARDAEAI